MFDPTNSTLFTPWTDPQSGVTSHVLRRRVAPLQQSFYFTNPCFTRDGRYLWLYCAFPPAGGGHDGRTLAVIDFEHDTLTHFPETQFQALSPAVDLDSGEVYWTTQHQIWKRGPRPGDEAQLVNALPEKWLKNRRPGRISMHLTFSADKRSVNLDVQLGAQWLVGDAPLDGSPASIWQEFDRCYSHGQFSPTNPDLMLIAQDFWIDAADGTRHDKDDRLWLIRRGEAARVLLPGEFSRYRTHEWWGADGDHVWFIGNHRETGVGVKKVNIHTGLETHVWTTTCSHVHCDRTGRYLVGDNYRREAPPGFAEGGIPRVVFHDTATGAETNILTAMPPDAYSADAYASPLGPRKRYHTDCHPQFCGEDRFICYTTTALGQVDLALTPVAGLNRSR